MGFCSVNKHVIFETKLMRYFETVEFISNFVISFTICKLLNMLFINVAHRDSFE
jgi:hypothetical protein